MTKIVRQIRIDGELAYVPLTKGKEAIIAVKDVHTVSGFNWCTLVTRNTCYAARGVWLAGGKQTMVLMHRTIVGATFGGIVDHKDGNGLNNERGNLRITTHAENVQNSRFNSANKSGIKGVCWDKSRNKWFAQIGYNGKKIKLGRYDRLEDAAKAYNDARDRLHREFKRECNEIH